MKRLIIMALIYCSFTQYAQSAALVEPYLGYNFAGRAGFNNKADVHGLGFGFRAGGSFNGFLVGIDIGFNWLDNEDIDDTVNATDAGLLLGYDWEFGLRIWTSMNFLTVYSYDNFELDGSGFKFGVGYSPIPFLSINLEYKEYFYFRVNEQELTQDMTYRSPMLSVSAPFYF